MLEGRYIHPIEYYKTLNLSADASSIVSPVFAAFCIPLICPKNAEALVRGNTEIFHCQHQMNLHFFDTDAIACHHLGYSFEELTHMSLYDIVHPKNGLDTLIEMHRTCKYLV